MHVIGVWWLTGARSSVHISKMWCGTPAGCTKKKGNFLSRISFFFGYFKYYFNRPKIMRTKIGTSVHLANAANFSNGNSAAARLNTFELDCNSNITRRWEQSTALFWAMPETSSVMNLVREAKAGVRNAWKQQWYVRGVKCSGRLHFWTLEKCGQVSKQMHVGEHILKTRQNSHNHQGRWCLGRRFHFSFYQSTIQCSSRQGDDRQ